MICRPEFFIQDGCSAPHRLFRMLRLSSQQSNPKNIVSVHIASGYVTRYLDFTEVAYTAAACLRLHSTPGPGCCARAPCSRRSTFLPRLCCGREQMGSEVVVLLCYHRRRCLEFILKASFNQAYFIIARTTYCTETQRKPLESKFTSNAKNTVVTMVLSYPVSRLLPAFVNRGLRPLPPSPHSLGCPPVTDLRQSLFSFVSSTRGVIRKDRK